MPCPFCSDDQPALDHEADTGAWSVRCTHCGITIGNYAGERSARSAWNRRASPTTPTEGPAQTLTPEALYTIVPPSATEYMSQPPAMEFSTEWQIGWDSCRNGVRHRVYDLIAASKSASTLTDPEGAS